MKIDALLWDYDGTLVNSVPKNISITKQILSAVAPRLTGDNLPHFLKSEELYHIANHQSKNWQDLYLNFYGMTEDEMNKAGSLWTAYQLKNETPVDLFSEIKTTIQQIQIPQGICSQNSSENIISVLKQNEIEHQFHTVIGYNDVPHDAQKPNPYGGIVCLNKILNSTKGKTIFYIGDHEGDVMFARNISKSLNGESHIVSIIVKYSGANTETWHHKPDIEIETPFQLIDLVNNF